jgi:RNA polymerase sigma factor (sigma-70 family)
MPTRDRTGDRALEDAYRRYHKHVLAFVASKISCRETAADLTQDAYIRFLCAKRQDDIRDMRSYLLRIASNLVIDHYRAQNAQSAPKEVYEISSMSDQLQTDEDVEGETVRKAEVVQVRRAVEGLSSGCQRIFWLSRLYGYKNVEIADREGVCLSTVEKNLSKATRRCRDYLAACAA